MSDNTKTIHIAIVGRPNVGKSTLFNRLIGKRKSITCDVQGTTRDRLYHLCDFKGKEVLLVDTGGIKHADEKSFDCLVDREVDKAVLESDYVLFICEVFGITSEEYRIIEDLRRRGSKLILVVNKVDDNVDQGMLNEFYKIGIGQPFFISALHGNNLELLYDHLYNLLPEKCVVKKYQPEFRLAIVGEPNAGKSTLLNQLLQKDRAVVSSLAGTTRDSIEDDFHYNDRVIRLVDTAGIKKKKKLKTTAAVFSLFRATESIKSADIVFLLADAQKGPQKDTRMIYKTIKDFNKACVVIVNKWDTISNVTMEDYKKALIRECGFLHNVPMHFISALTGRKVTETIDLALEVWENYTSAITTKELNDFLDMVKRKHPPQPGIKFKYIVQVNIKPPTFVIFVKNKKNIKQNYINFLTNAMVQYFEFKGVFPIVYFREEKPKA